MTNGVGEPGGRPAVDPSRLANLRAVDPSLVAEIADLWLTTTPAQLAALSAGLQAADATAVATAAHSLRGSSANIGADDLAAACEALELLARDRAEVARLEAAEAEVRVQHARAAAELALEREQA